MKTIQDLKAMIKEPASRKWFEKHGTPKGKAIKKFLGGSNSKHKANKHDTKVRSNQRNEDMSTYQNM